jgi:hypothetical protein
MPIKTVPFKLSDGDITMLQAGINNTRCYLMNRAEIRTEAEQAGRLAYLVRLTTLERRIRRAQRALRGR